MNSAELNRVLEGARDVLRPVAESVFMMLHALLRHEADKQRALEERERNGALGHD